MRSHVKLSLLLLACCTRVRDPRLPLRLEGLSFSMQFRGTNITVIQAAGTQPPRATGGGFGN